MYFVSLPKIYSLKVYYIDTLHIRIERDQNNNESIHIVVPREQKSNYVQFRSFHNQKILVNTDYVFTETKNIKTSFLFLSYALCTLNTNLTYIMYKYADKKNNKRSNGSGLKFKHRMEWKGIKTTVVVFE